MMTDTALHLPYQTAALDMAARTPLLVCEKSRRTGMTWAFAADAVLEAALPEGGMDIFYVACNQEMAREFMAYCADIAVALQDFGLDEAQIATWRISFPSGFSITALPSTPRNLRGKQGRVIIDEAAFHDDLPGLLKAALALLMWGGRVAVISTHNGADSDFARLIADIHAGRQPGRVHRITLKDALADGLFKRICARRGQPWSLAAQAQWEAQLRAIYGDSAAEELDVIPVDRGGTWLSRAAIEAVMEPAFPVLRLDPPTGFDAWRLLDRTAWLEDWVADVLDPALANFDARGLSYFGQDFGRTSDLSVIAAGQFDAGAILQCRLVIEMCGVPFRQQKQLLDALCQSLPNFTAGRMDARGNGQQLAEDMADDHGSRAITGVMASPTTYRAMMPRLKARIEDRTIILPRSEGILTDLRMIRLADGTPRIPHHTQEREDGTKTRRHGDAAIALMHLIAASDEGPPPFEFHTLGPRASFVDTEEFVRGF